MIRATLFVTTKKWKQLECATDRQANCGLAIQWNIIQP